MIKRVKLFIFAHMVTYFEQQVGTLFRDAAAVSDCNAV
jgi:hypothetical protein